MGDEIECYQNIRLRVPNEILSLIVSYLENFQDYLNMERSYYELIPLRLDFVPNIVQYVLNEDDEEFSFKMAKKLSCNPHLFSGNNGPFDQFSLLTKNNIIVALHKFGLLKNVLKDPFLVDLALQYTARKGYLEDVKFLFERGANIHANDDDAIRWAAYKGHLDVVKFLFEKGSNIHADDDFAIRSAACNGHLGVVEFLVEKGSNIHADDDFAIRKAAENGHLGVVKFLFEKGSNIHADYDFAIRKASENGHLGVVKFLFEKGANIQVRNNYAIRWAAANGHLEVVKFFTNIK